jgi:hypothetical protein
MLVITFVFQWHFIVFTIDEMTSALGIRVFKVKPKVTATSPFRNEHFGGGAVGIEMPEINRPASTRPSDGSDIEKIRYGVMK